LERERGERERESEREGEIEKGVKQQRKDESNWWQCHSKGFCF
jgi:hypothetical protein